MSPDLDAVAADAAVRVKDAIALASSSSARSAQSANYVIGPSEVGRCRSYLGFMARQTPKDPDFGIKLAAFVGTWIGKGVEDALATHFGARTEVPVTATYPSGRMISGHIDVLFPDCLWDIKTTATFEFLKRDGPDFNYIAQVQTYLLAAIQNGLLPEDATCSLVYINRLAKWDTEEPYVVTMGLDMSIIEEIDSRLDDVQYALVHDEELPKDMPETFCQVACPFYSSCRLPRQHSQGVVQDEGALRAVKYWTEGDQLEREGKRLKAEAKDALRNFEGLAEDKVIVHTYVGPAEVPGYTRKGYTKTEIRRAR